MKDRIISEYGRALKKGSDKTIVDFSESLSIDFNFQVHEINDLVREFNGVMPPNRISHFVIAFIKKGLGKKTIGNYTFEIQPDLGLIFPKNVIHSTKKWSLETSGYMLSFDDSIFEEQKISTSFLHIHKLFKLSVIPYRIFDKPTSEKIESLFAELIVLNNSGDTLEKKLVVLKLAELILIYQKVFLSTKNITSEKETLFDRFVDLLELNYKTERQVNYYSSKLTVHANHLNRTVHLSSKMSAKDYINNRVLQEAKYMLTSTDLPVKEIAYDLGFSDCNYFSRFFKRNIQKSPMEYRRENI